MRGRRLFGVSLSLILINMAAVMERADENLLPAVYKEISETFNVGPSDLGYLTFTRNFIQGLCSPLAGILVIHYDRPTVLSIGTIFWALSTAAVGISQYFTQVALWRAVNGIGLAIVTPALQSFVADSYLDGVRGVGFGFLGLVGNLGGIGGGVVATIMAGHVFLGMPGWRFAFIMMAMLSTGIGFLVFMFVVDPRRIQGASTTGDVAAASERNVLIESSNASSTPLWKESWTATKAVIKVQTFQIIVLQGLVGSLPWTAMVFFTMWFELIGFDHSASAGLLSLFAIGAAIGGLVGGAIADKMSRLYPYSGRIICAQFSAFMGIPFSWYLLTIIPQSIESWYTYAVALFIMGTTISWNATATNGPMFAEVVPLKHRTMIYAFDRAFEGSFSSFAAPLVGIISEKVYGYDPKPISSGSSPMEAFALSRGLFAMMAIPFGLCCLCYSPLYFIFKRDCENARLASLKEGDTVSIS